MFTFIENLFTLKTKAGLRAGFIFVCFLTGIGSIVAMSRSFSTVPMPVFAPFTIGTELLAMFISVIIYYSCTRESDHVEEHTARFAILLSTSSFGVFLDQIAWLMMSSMSVLNANSVSGKSPGQILADTNDLICASDHNDMFVTVWLGILEALNRDPQTSPQKLLANVREAVDLFTGSEEQFDDLTMLCLEYKGGKRQ